jgi:hypothetical protein
MASQTEVATLETLTMTSTYLCVTVRDPTPAIIKATSMSNLREILLIVISLSAIWMLPYPTECVRINPIPLESTGVGYIPV